MSLLERLLLSCLPSCFYFLVSCHNGTGKQSDVKDTIVKKESPPNNNETDEEEKRVTYAFLADSLLPRHKDVVKFYFTKYAPDSCVKGFYNRSQYDDFEGLGYIGDINHNNIKDSVFVLYPLSFCQFPGEQSNDGQAYYFLDTTLPRLQTESYCCHPASLFAVGDIDEDGIKEIGQFYSSCASHYKSLYVYTLKQHHWKEAGHVVYDLFFADSTKPYSAYVRKTAKSQFEMLEITDLTDKKYIGKTNWRKFTIKD